MVRPWADVIKDNPIRGGLDDIRRAFRSSCRASNIPSSAAALEQLSRDQLQNLVLTLLSALLVLPAAVILQMSSGESLYIEIVKLNAAVATNNFDLDRVQPLLKEAIEEADDSAIWNQVKSVIDGAVPSPLPIQSSTQQTPWLRDTSSFQNSAEYHKYIDSVLKEQLGPIYVGLPKFWDVYFGSINGLKPASEAFFKQCVGGPSPLFESGWIGWPTDAGAADVFGWFAAFYEKLAAFAADWQSGLSRRRRPLAKPVDGSAGKHKMDISLVSDSRARKDTECDWPQILVPGELRGDPNADKAPETWLDLGRYARDVLASQDTRRYVLGFTICGSLMRVWLFDRLGGIASEQFDINKDGFRFVFIILGFFWMDEEQLGFDPTIQTAGHTRFIEIERNGSKQRVIIDRVMVRSHRMAGRATTCWRAHPEGDPKTRLVIKDSWQYPKVGEEGELLREITGKGVINVARYYHHETVLVRGMDDDIRNNVRQGLDMATAVNYPPPLPGKTAAEGPRRTRSSTSRKRPSSPTNSALPPSKRPCHIPPKDASLSLNRVHRRVIVRDYGKTIYKASSRLALITGLKGCIEGYESLHKAGILHRDISTSNLMINEDRDNPSWPSFLIDLDYAVREDRDRAAGSKDIVGTRAFMAIGALLGEEHSFMHDLESFFWVLFWICIHYDASGNRIGPTEFNSWKHEDDSGLARSKLGIIRNEVVFIRVVAESFTPHYQRLITLVNRLRIELFPGGERRRRPEPKLYSSIKRILHDAQKEMG